MYPKDGADDPNLQWRFWVKLELLELYSIVEKAPLGNHKAYRMHFTADDPNIFSCHAYLKVNKSRKQFLEFSILPKNKRKTWKNFKSSQDNFILCLVQFLEELRIPKNVFEIYWPLGHDLGFFKNSWKMKSFNHILSKT